MHTTTVHGISTIRKSIKQLFFITVIKSTESINDDLPFLTKILSFFKGLESLERN